VRGVPVPRAVRGTSYFLISYPRTEHNGQGSERAPDYWVIKFYDDLCRHVEELATVPAGTRVGILDRAWWVVDDWVAALSADRQAISGDRVAGGRLRPAAKPLRPRRRSQVRCSPPAHHRAGVATSSTTGRRHGTGRPIGRHRSSRLRSATSGIAVQGVPSMTVFGAILPLLISAVGNRYLGNAPAFPPDGSVVEKPTLRAFMPDPSNPLERAGA
jgi:hypothetical protein